LPHILAAHFSKGGGAQQLLNNFLLPSSTDREKPLLYGGQHVGAKEEDPAVEPCRWARAYGMSR
jgi:hypothetical protein